MNFIIMLILAFGIFLSTNADKICAVRKRDIKGSPDGQNSADIIEDVFNTNNHNQTENDIKYEKCNQYCYAFWQEETTLNETKINIFFQGCWNQEGQECEHSECIANRWTRALNNAKFCCCREDYCNVNVTDPYENKLLLISTASKNNLSVIIAATEFIEQSDPEQLMLIIVLTLASVLIVSLAVTLLVYKVYKNSVLKRLGKPLPYNDNCNEGNGLKTGIYTFDHLKLTTIVGEGRYGSVWQGSMGDQDVAVKIISSHCQSYFLNEREIYRLPFMEHPSLLHYYGSDERVKMDGSPEYLLVFSYVPGGTLTEFLRYHVFDWMTFCKMSLSIVKGLAYLHTDIRRGDKFKPCIAHRDINSRNILIKADGTCCICDLGLAVQISGSKYFSHGEEQHAETKSINDVGTLHYMAPEVLEGAVNLRDCESSLKQIDVYAMGLILWELVSRCSDVYVPATEIPPYKQPFEKEIGLHPTFEQMQVLVARNKARPLLEGNIADKPGVRLIRETMEDCWDSDAEARLTALCIEERIMELQSRRITMYFSDGSPLVNSHHGLVPSTTNSLYTDSAPSSGTHHDPVHQAAGHDAVDTNAADISTTENSSHEHSVTAKNSNEHASYQPLLQPHQGRNPCLERNLMMQSDSSEEIGCQGNVLVNRSSKHMTSSDRKIATNTSPSPHNHQHQNTEIQSLVPHDYLSQQHQIGIQHQQLTMRPATPIPYVQNVISESSVGSTTTYNKIKQTNIHDATHHYTSLSNADSPRHRRRFSGWSQLKRLLGSKRSNQQAQPIYTHYRVERDDSKSNLLAKNPNQQAKSTIVELQERKNSLDRIEVEQVPRRVKERIRNGQTARFSLIDDRIMSTDKKDKVDKRSQRGVNSNSMPFGMDLSEDDDERKFDHNNVTCF